MITTSIKIKLHKCFGESEQGFDCIYPVNIIIGKNNSGKSTLVDLIESLTTSGGNLHDKPVPITKCVFEVELNDLLMRKANEQYLVGTKKDREANLVSLKNYIDNNSVSKKIKFSIINNKIQYHQDAPKLGNYLFAFEIIFLKLFSSYEFKRINAEREIKPEVFYSKAGLQKNGDNATSIVWKYLSVKDYNQNLIKKDFLGALNTIIKPDIEFKDIIIKEDNYERRDSSTGEIYFEDIDGQWIGLSKMGSGVKTIILTLLNMIVIPEMEDIKKEKIFFGFEELENNLHPSLQRRLFDYIYDYAIKYQSHFIITTHSNIPIDLFISKANAQIIHIEKIGKYSYTKKLDTKFESKVILKDLDYRASDLLLSNGIIWVEGPSDAIYLELFLDLYIKHIDSQKKVNYCIQSLSTALWKYAGFTNFEWTDFNTDITNQIISLAKINHNHIIIIDNDNNYDDRKPSEFALFTNGTGKNKARLIHESMQFSNNNENDLENNNGESKHNSLFFWINKGTIETYLQYFINQKGKKFSRFFDLTTSRGFFEKKRMGKDSSKSKVELASEIAQISIKSGLSFEDFAPGDSELSSKIKRLYNTILDWNT